jgi:hypothetical protein
LAVSKTFSEKVDGMYHVDDNGCWLWTGFTRRGYAEGRDNVSGKALRIHRLMQAHTYGPIHPDSVACHKCHVRNCINPEHIYMGTPQSNARDSAKLTVEQVRDIKASALKGVELARIYQISQQSICDIRKGRTWHGITQGRR